MFSRIGNYVKNSAENIPIWTNVYGIARSLMAGTLALVLIINPAELIFIPAQGISEFPQCTGNISLFCFGSNDYLTLNIIRWIVVALLVVIASGWRPRYTGLLHFYIAYSYHEAAMVIDGGDQVHLVLSLLLIPITLCDPRKWHWKTFQPIEITNNYIYLYMISLTVIYLIRVQVSIIYLNAAYAKVTKEYWINGTAIYYFLNDYMLGLNDTLSMVLTPILETQFIVVLTWGTIVLEFLLFAALIAPKYTWKYFLIPGLILHGSIALAIGLYSFSTIMFAALIVFLRPFEQKFQFSMSTIRQNINNISLFRKNNKKFLSSEVNQIKVEK
ncbi:sporulation-delaying protein SdpB family protein [Halalkalibacter sp. AB-rgal2]|uniref:sporulation-delaying protein SdpB family protein n=1 Tax=Halalkalibacter sp. AB-rgal2 TaxID=3242695 RepID=UPI00359E69B4